MPLLKSIKITPQIPASTLLGLKCLALPNYGSKRLPCSGSKKKPQTPRVQLSDGRRIPQIGIGTWGSTPEEVATSILDAISVGYRHIDCAQVYGNEVQVGCAIREKINDKTVKREDLWITSKLWNNFHNPSVVCKACEMSLNDLGIDYLDLYLMHWPMGFKEDWKDMFPTNGGKKIVYTDFDYVDTWKAMEALVKQGLCKSIGVANFNKCQIERVLEVTKTPIVMAQFECHPYLTQQKLRDFCKSKKITVTAYSPLGSPTNPFRKPTDPTLMDDPELKCIAERLKKTTAQVLIRFHIELGNVVIPKGVLKEHIANNFDVFNFKLEKDDIDKLLCLNRNYRFVPRDQVTDHKYYPFGKDDD